MFYLLSNPLLDSCCFALSWTDPSLQSNQHYHLEDWILPFKMYTGMGWLFSVQCNRLKPSPNTQLLLTLTDSQVLTLYQRFCCGTGMNLPLTNSSLISEFHSRDLSNTGRGLFFADCTRYGLGPRPHLLSHLNVYANGKSQWLRLHSEQPCGNPGLTVSQSVWSFTWGHATGARDWASVNSS